MSAKRKRRRATKMPDLFASSRKGTEMLITVEAGLLRTLDDFRSHIDQTTGVQLTRRQVLEGLLRKVWYAKIVEASALEVGSKISKRAEGASK
jgi:hypothetical protein